MSWLNSPGDIRSSFVEQRVHFGTPASGEILPPNKVLVREAFRYLSCSRALLVVEKREPHLEHLKKSSSSLGPDPILSTVFTWTSVEYRGYLSRGFERLENFGRCRAYLPRFFFLEARVRFGLVNLRSVKNATTPTTGNAMDSAIIVSVIGLLELMMSSSPTIVGESGMTISTL